MTLSIRVQRIDIVDNDGVGPVPCDVHCIITESAAPDVAVGLGQQSDSRRAFLSRAAFNALVGAMQRPNTDNWPDGTLPHPVAKAP